MSTNKWTPFRNVGNVQSGAGFPIVYQGLTEGEYPFYKVGDMNSEGNEIFMSQANHYISDEVRRELGAKVIPPDSIIFPKVGGAILTNKKRITTLPCCIDNNLMSIWVDPAAYSKKYFYYFFNSIDLFELSNKAGLPSITQTALYELKVPIPPLPEQERIVAKLDAAFAAIDKAKANVERNLHNAKELFQSKLNEVFENLESQYERTPIASVCKEIFAGGDAPRENFSEARTDKFHIPIIANAVKDHGLYGYTDLVRVSEPSITIAARGSGTGHTEIRLEPFFPIVRLIVLIPKREMIDLSFFCYSIKNLEILRSGSAIPQLTVPMIKGYSLAVPPLETQEVLVEMLNSLEGSLQSLETYYTRKLTELETLKKSVLERAFRGEI